MKPEHITLTVAAIAAATSLAGAFFNQRGALNLEQEKWRQAQQDGHRAIVVEFAKELTAAHQRAEWLVWTARNSSDLLSQKDFESFDKEAKASLPRIFGYRVLLAAKRPNIYPKLDVLVKRYYAADQCVGLTQVSHSTPQPSIESTT